VKTDTVYGFICNKKDEKLIMGRLNDFLSQYDRTFSKSKSKGLLEVHLPLKYKHIYFNLNKDTGTFMELTPNEDSEGNYRYLNNRDLGWIFRVIIHKHFPGYEKSKTESYISQILNVIGFEYIKLLETDDIGE
jgi:hypothetical protein